FLITAPIPRPETTTGLPRSIGSSGLHHRSIVGQFDACFNAGCPDLHCFARCSGSRLGSAHQSVSNRWSVSEALGGELAQVCKEWRISLKMLSKKRSRGREAKLKRLLRASRLDAAELQARRHQQSTNFA